MKLSLITLHSVQNYGSALQTYASQRFFEELGCTVCVVDYVRENNLRENLVRTCLSNSRFWNKNSFTRLAFKLLKEKELNKRFSLFEDFIEKNVTLTPHRYLNAEDFEMFPVEADIYCTGSDQTWNSYWNRGLLEPFFLTFAKDKMKISYASSFGKKQLDEDEKEAIKRLLSQYSAITVRENEAVEILKELGIESKQVLDPTLMLSADQWRSFAQDQKINQPYILIYQLGTDNSFNKMAKKLARFTKMRLIRIGFGNEAYLYGGHVIKNPSVKEFLGLLCNARYIITDSFHATSFAINLNVEFFSYLPKVFSGRLTDILKMFSLEDRTFDNFEKLGLLSHSAIDFKPVNEKLEQERTRCIETVKQMLEMR